MRARKGGGGREGKNGLAKTRQVFEITWQKNFTLAKLAAGTQPRVYKKPACDRDEKCRVEKRDSQNDDQDQLYYTDQAKRVTTSGSLAGYIHSTTVLCDKYSLPIVRIKCKERAWNQPTGVCVGK